MTTPDLHDRPALLEARALTFARNDEPVFGPTDPRFPVDESGVPVTVRGEDRCEVPVDRSGDGEHPPVTDTGLLVRHINP